MDKLCQCQRVEIYGQSYPTTAWPMPPYEERYQQLDLFADQITTTVEDAEVKAVATVLQLKRKARELRRQAALIEELAEELESSLNAAYEVSTR